MNKTIFVIAAAAFAMGLASCKCRTGGSCAPADSSKVAAADTNLVLKPTAAQIASAHRVGNKHCPTDGEKLGSMGAPVPVVYRGQLVELCCAGCPAEFAKDPAKYLAIAQADTAASE